MKKVLLILFFVFFLSLNFIVGSYYDNFDAKNTILCDNYAMVFKDNWGSSLDSPQECYNSITPSINTQTVFTTGSSVVYDCEGTESFTYNIIYNANAEADGYVYEERPFYYSRDIDCSGSSFYIGNNYWSIWDINADRDITTRPEFEIPGEWSDIATDSVSFSPSTISNTETIPQTDLTHTSVFLPYPKVPIEITERGFAPTSVLGLFTYFDQDLGVTDSVVEEYTDLVCDGDITCFSLPTTAGIRYSDYETLINEPDIDYLFWGQIDGNSRLGTPYYLGSNMHAALLEFFEEQHLPIIARFSIEWDSYECGSGVCVDNSFRGYYYYYLILGYSDSESKYLIQSPAGDRFYITSGQLYDWWDYTDYDGLYLYKNPSSPTKEKRVDLVHVNSGTIVQPGQAIVAGGSYRYEINDEYSEYYAQTDNPRFQVDYKGSANYDEDRFGKISSNIIFDKADYPSGEVASSYLVQDKVEYAFDTIYYDIIDGSDFSLPTYKDIIPSVISTDTNEVTLSFGTNYPGSTDCFLLANSNPIDLVSKPSDYVYDHNCTFDDIDPRFAEDDLVVRVASTNPDTGIRKTYDYPIMTKINHPSQFTFLPQEIKCINSGYCEFPSIDIFSDLGSYNVGDNFYVLPSQISMQVFFNDLPDYFRSLANVPYSIPYNNGLYSTIDFNFNYFESGENSVYACDLSDDCFYLKNGDYVKYYLYQTFNSPLYANYINEQEQQSDIIVYDAILKDDIIAGQTSKQSTPDDTGFGIEELDYYFESSDPNAGPYTNDVYDKCTFNIDVDNNLPATQFTDQKIWFDVNGNKEIDNIAYTDSIVNMNSTGCVGDSCYDYMQISPDCFGDSTECEIQLPYEITGTNKFYCNIQNQYFTETVDVYSCFSDIGVQDTFDDFSSYYNHLVSYYDQSSCSVYTTKKPNFYDDGLGYYYELEDVKVCREGDIIDTTGEFFCSKIGEVNLQCDPNEEQFDYDDDGVVMASDQCCGYDDSIDTDMDGIPDGCDYNIDINITIVNLCNNGIQDSGSPSYETDIDYGGQCGNCTNNILDPLIGEIYVDYGGKCGNCTNTEDVNSPESDIIYNKIKIKTFPFGYEQCELDQPQQAFPILLLVVVFFIIPIFLVLPIGSFFIFYFIYRMFFKTKKKNKKNRKR